MGVYGEISASVDCLVASASIRGSLDLASFALPVGGGAIVNSLAPFSADFGDVVSLQGSFLSGSVDLEVSMFWCCCLCGWSCCFNCGGSCNKQTTYNLLSWTGLNFDAPISEHGNLCARSSPTTESLPYTPDVELTVPHLDFDDSLPSYTLNNEDGDVDNEDWCDCQHLFEPDFLETFEFLGNWPVNRIPSAVSASIKDTGRSKTKTRLNTDRHGRCATCSSNPHDGVCLLRGG